MTGHTTSGTEGGHDFFFFFSAYVSTLVGEATFRVAAGNVDVVGQGLEAVEGGRGLVVRSWWSHFEM